MSIKKYYEITCDFCNAAIGHFNCNKAVAIEMAIEDGAIIDDKKSFCDEKCYQNFIDEQDEHIKKMFEDESLYKHFSQHQLEGGGEMKTSKKMTESQFRKELSIIKKLFDKKVFINPYTLASWVNEHKDEEWMSDVLSQKSRDLVLGFFGMLGKFQ